MINQQLRSYLDRNHIDYATIGHSPTFTASQTAQSAHFSGKALVKVVMVKINGQLAMVALPANTKLNLHEFKEFTHAKDVSLAEEYEFRDKFSECEVGAMPPLGNLYGLDVYLADSLTRHKQIAFNAGTHSDLLQMSSRDFVDLVHPKKLPFA